MNNVIVIPFVQCVHTGSPLDEETNAYKLYKSHLAKQGIRSKGKTHFFTLENMNIDTLKINRYWVFSCARQELFYVYLWAIYFLEHFRCSLFHSEGSSATGWFT